MQERSNASPAGAVTVRVHAGEGSLLGSEAVQREVLEKLERLANWHELCESPDLSAKHRAIIAHALSEIKDAKRAWVARKSDDTTGRELLAEELTFFSAQVMVAAKQAARERALASRAEKAALPPQDEEEEADTGEDVLRAAAGGGAEAAPAVAAALETAAGAEAAVSKAPLAAAFSALPRPPPTAVLSEPTSRRGRSSSLPSGTTPGALANVRVVAASRVDSSDDAEEHSDRRLSVCSQLASSQLSSTDQHPEPTSASEASIIAAAHGGSGRWLAMNKRMSLVGRFASGGRYNDSLTPIDVSLGLDTDGQSSTCRLLMPSTQSSSAAASVPTATTRQVEHGLMWRNASSRLVTTEAHTPTAPAKAAQRVWSADESASAVARHLSTAARAHAMRTEQRRAAAQLATRARCAGAPAWGVAKPAATPMPAPRASDAAGSSEHAKRMMCMVEPRALRAGMLGRG